MIDAAATEADEDDGEGAFDGDGDENPFCEALRLVSQNLGTHMCYRFLPVVTILDVVLVLTINVIVVTIALRFRMICSGLTICMWAWLHSQVFTWQAA